MILHAGDRRLAVLHLDRLVHRFNFILSLPQSETERLLTEDLAALGVRVERGTALARKIHERGTAKPYNAL